MNVMEKLTMHTVELYELAVHVAESLGYDVRQEHLGGAQGGACELAGRKCVFVDLTLAPVEQLDQVAQALAQDPGAYGSSIPAPIRELIGMRKAA